MAFRVVYSSDSVHQELVTELYYNDHIYAVITNEDQNPRIHFFDTPQNGLPLFEVMQKIQQISADFLPRANDR
jgi:hypothetical protein